MCRSVLWFGQKTWEGMDFAGEVVSHFFGLTHSKYQWIVNMKEREEEELYLEKLCKKQKKQLYLHYLLQQEKKKLMELERGSGETPQNMATATSEDIHPQVEE